MILSVRDLSYYLAILALKAHWLAEFGAADRSKFATPRTGSLSVNDVQMLAPKHVLLCFAVPHKPTDSVSHVEAFKLSEAAVFFSRVIIHQGSIDNRVLLPHHGPP
jgi:hypothetical protein